MQLAKELSKLTAAQRKAEMNARFWAAMRAALTGAGASDPDVQALLQDPYFSALVNWNNTPEPDQERIQREHPETVDLTEVIEDARDDIHDLSRWLDSPVRRFLDDVAAPLSALAMIHPVGRAGAMAYQGVRTAIAMAPRMRAAAAIIGAGAVAGYDRVRAFFSEMSGGDGGGDRGSSSWRKAQSAYNDSKFWDSLKTGNTIKGKIVHFGENINQHWHAFRHVIENKINPAQVRKLIEQDLSNNLHRITSNKVLQQTIKFDGKSITYRAYEHLSGKIKIGSIRICK
jgi:hypothetical protein